MICTHCGREIEDEERFVRTNEGVVRGTTIDPASGRGTYHLECWPGVSRIDDPRNPESEQPSHTVQSPPDDAALADRTATPSAPECSRCGRTVTDGERLISLTQFVNHAADTGLGGIGKLLRGDFVSGELEPIETGGMYHRDCWPGLARDVDDPLDLWVDSRGEPTAEQFRTPFGHVSVTNDEITLNQSVRFFITHWHRQHPLLTVAIGGGVLLALLSRLGVVSSVSALGVVTVIGVLVFLILWLTVSVYDLRWPVSHLRSTTLPCESVDKVEYHTGGRLTCPSFVIIYREGDTWTGQPFALSWQWSGMPEADAETVKAAFAGHGIPVIESPYPLTWIY